MKKWTDFQTVFQKATNNYEHTVLDNLLKVHVDKLISYAEDNNIKFPVVPFIPEGYADELIKWNKNVSSFPINKIHAWVDDPKYKHSFSLPISVMRDTDFPSGMRQAFRLAFRRQYRVYDNNVTFRIHKLNPGDLVMLHYDPVGKFTRPGLSTKYTDKRAFLFLSDHSPGQVFYLGDDTIEYKKYDMYTFNVQELLHGSCNFGYESRYMMIITWSEPKE